MTHRTCPSANTKYDRRDIQPGSTRDSRGFINKVAAEWQKPLMIVCGMDGRETRQRSVDLQGFSENALLADSEKYQNAGQ
ncbi:hypothetical protein Psi02_42790 [Planotetraspora silvatica]|uniref:Uncharacterized protein n=1 Tax=Planotetraspora silvatica TaxID=234614 RepID=A0A8J3XP44_9ACTN|nr:hypothetical protein [Planotetraspora silvatica]GII47855.1 hypothetical protein Psi02_42790 [Planotetraspora silvatica]